jgi:hypothetical protein
MYQADSGAEVFSPETVAYVQSSVSHGSRGLHFLAAFMKQIPGQGAQSDSRQQEKQ